MRKIFNFQFSILKSRRGFTLVELLVALGLFSIVTSIAVGGFVRALRTQRQVAALIAADSNVSLVLEQMTREIRTGYNFCRPDDSGSATCFSESELSFTNASGDFVSYRLNGSGIEKGAGGVFHKITGGNVSVQYLRFTLFGNLSGDGWSPRITVSVGIAAKEVGVSGNIVGLQTTISARQLDS